MLARRAKPFNVVADELLRQPELAFLPRQADADVRRGWIEDRFAMPVMWRDLRHHGRFRAPHHVVKRVVAEAVIRRPRRRVFADAIVATREGVAHVRRLAVGREMPGRAVANLRAAVSIGGSRDLRIELNRRKSELRAVAIDEPHELAAQRHPGLVSRPLALRECRAEREGDREDREK